MRGDMKESGIIRRVTLALAVAALVASPVAAKKKEKHAPPVLADPWPSTYRPLPRTDMLIVGATVLDGAGGRLEGDVLVRDGRIAAIGRDLDRTGAAVVDGRGKWLTPGIIDVHSHNGTFVVPLTSVDDHASDVTEISDPNVADTWIEHAINPQDVAFTRALSGGVTTLQVLPGSTPLIGGRSVVLKTVPATTMQGMKFPGAPQGLKMACGENPKGHFGEAGRAPNSRQGELALLRAAFSAAQDYTPHRGGKGKPPRRDLKLETLAAVLAGDIRVQMHCYRADDMAVMLGLAREFGFRIAAFHHAVEAYKIPALLREAGTCAAVWPDWWGFKMEAADGIRENAAFVDAAGACAMMHSDSPQIGQRLTIEAAKAAGAGRRAGLSLPPETIIGWVTRNPAKALGLETSIGTIAPGYNADLVLWSGDPFSIYSHADRVYVDGALVYDRADPAYRPRADFELGRPQVAPR
ncbi:amidohydrolase family protein [Sphingosinicella soli]|uniref:Imidazolonepropionase-like amidohydrolase n=1 Tax=Sphingosinicella soli TaxID=333708 RepID=A0A7W7B2A2_9SPHN|nr:amidohydrolase family protein [Sphingosinicella soli]MBB4632666.1 imidazolonepropionase-like amidohydrolase [Sphingosinicella soli]